MHSKKQLPPFFGRLFAFLFSLSIIIDASGQGTICPPNIDFETGSFANWQCSQGFVEAIGDENVVTLTETPPSFVHNIIPAGFYQLDPFGGFPQSCPNGSGYSIMLGNSSGGHQAEGLSYTFTIPAGTSQFSLTYYYAVVLQNPNHLINEQPRFRARVIDMSDSSEIECVSFDFAANSSLPGFKVSPVQSDVLYREWTPVTINLSKYAGKTMKLEFITSDCTFNRHFGYAYVDVNSNCTNSFVAANLCDGDDFITLTAPTGFASYQWYLNNDYRDTISTLQTFPVHPIPPSATVYNLVMIPYPGFGCVDTFLATIKRQPKPEFDAGPDKMIECNESIQLGSPPSADHIYSWTPPDKLSNPRIANPMTNKFLSNPVNYIVKTTDVNTGCFSVDSVLISPVNCFLLVPTAFTPNGDGLNDVLTPIVGGTKELRRFSIYNRNGTMVFSTSKQGEGWDGTFKGVKQATAVFVWVLEYISLDNRHLVEKGTILLIR